MPTVTLIDSIPRFVSPQEHASLVGSTPNSFNDLPPVLRHKEENVTVKLDPSVPGFTDEDSAKGALYVIESALVFLSATGKGFQVEYPVITLHAISRAESGPSIYCQLDDSPQADIAGSEDEESELKELTIIPSSESSLEPIFEALSLCASLHPDAMAEDDDGADDAFIDPSTANFEVFTGSEGEELSEVGRAALEHLESIIEDPHHLISDPDGEALQDAEEQPAVDGVNGNGVSEDIGASRPTPVARGPIAGR